MSYASPSDILLRFDANLLGQLCNDTGTQLTPTQLLSSPSLQAALDDATGIIESALYTAYKYTSDNLSNLTANSTSMLKRLCCDLAVVMVAQRRGYDYSDKYPMLNLSLDLIQKLRYGERVLDFAQNEQAGLPESVHPSVVEQQRVGLVTTNWKLFPIR